MQKSLYVNLEVSKFTKVNQDILHKAEVKKVAQKLSRQPLSAAQLKTHMTSMSAVLLLSELIAESSNGCERNKSFRLAGLRV